MYLPKRCVNRGTADLYSRTEISAKFQELISRWDLQLIGIISISQMYRRLSQIVMNNQVQVYSFNDVHQRRRERPRFHWVCSPKSLSLSVFWEATEYKLFACKWGWIPKCYLTLGSHRVSGTICSQRTQRCQGSSNDQRLKVSTWGWGKTCGQNTHVNLSTSHILQIPLKITTRNEIYWIIDYGIYLIN